jgi:hypothetical protein
VLGSASNATPVLLAKPILLVGCKSFIHSKAHTMFVSFNSLHQFNCADASAIKREDAWAADTRHNCVLPKLGVSLEHTQNNQDPTCDIRPPKASLSPPGAMVLLPLLIATVAAFQPHACFERRYRGQKPNLTGDINKLLIYYCGSWLAAASESITEHWFTCPRPKSARTPLRMRLILNRLLHLASVHS